MYPFAVNKHLSLPVWFTVWWNCKEKSRKWPILKLPHSKFTCFIFISVNQWRTALQKLLTIYGANQLRGTNLDKSLQFYLPPFILFAHNQISCTGVLSVPLAPPTKWEGFWCIFYQCDQPQLASDHKKCVVVSGNHVCSSVWKSCPGSKDPVHSAAGRYIKPACSIPSEFTKKSTPQKATNLWIPCQWFSELDGSMWRVDGGQGGHGNVRWPWLSSLVTCLTSRKKHWKLEGESFEIHCTVSTAPYCRICLNSIFFSISHDSR